jgi:hypothetical protein
MSNGIKELGLQIERLATSLEARSQASIASLDMAREAANAQYKAEQERDELLRLVEGYKLQHESDLEYIEKLKAAPKEGTWAWACEMAFKNPGKKYSRGAKHPSECMKINSGNCLLLNGKDEEFYVVIEDVIATDWQEAT